MRKAKLLRVVILLAAMSFVGYINGQDADCVLDNQLGINRNVNGKVKSINETGYKAEAKFGEIELGDKEYIIQKKYDNAGQLSEYNKFDVGYGENWTYKYEYNDKGACVKILEYVKYSSDSSIKLVAKSIFEYDEEGNLLKLSIYDNKGNIKNTYIYKYNSDNNLSERMQYGADNKLSGTQEYKYDGKEYLLEEHGLISKKVYSYNNGKLSKISSYWVSLAGGNLSLAFISTYNQYGDCVEWKDFGGSRTYSYQYTYDDKGNWIKEIIYYNDIDGLPYPIELKIRKIDY